MSIAEHMAYAKK